MDGADGTAVCLSNLGLNADGWLGSLRRHWQLRRLKYVCRLSYGNALASDTRKEGQVTVWGSNGPVGFHDVPNTEGPCIIVGRKGSFGKVNFSRSPVFAIDTTFFVDSRSTSVGIRWLYYILGWLQLDKVTKDSAVPGLDREDAYNRVVPVPPRGVQRTIVRFLDHADQRIQRYIRAKERLIELLEEQKQAIIHQAVTGQIDVRTGQPYPAYKDSGVEWLGEVPEHWEVKKLKYLTRFVNGIAFKPSEWRDTGIPIIRIENLNGGNAFNYTDREGLPEQLLIRPGDIVFAWSGNRGTSFGSFRWDRDFAGYLNQHIFKLTQYALEREYFHYMLRAVTKHVEDNAHGIIGLVHITKPALGAVAVPVAPRAEQGRIASWLDEQLSRSTHAMDQVSRQIDLLREYRIRLIAEVVTGELDVREAAASLP